MRRARRGHTGEIDGFGAQGVPRGRKANSLIGGSNLHMRYVQVIGPAIGQITILKRSIPDWLQFCMPSNLIIRAQPCHRRLCKALACELGRFNDGFNNKFKDRWSNVGATWNLSSKNTL